MTVNVRIIDIAEHKATPKVNIECSCGVVITTTLSEGIPKAASHIREVHRRGKLHYKSLTRAISLDGTSQPVLGKARMTGIDYGYIEQ